MLTPESFFLGKAAYQKRRKLLSSMTGLYGQSSLFGKKILRSGNKPTMRSDNLQVLWRCRLPRLLGSLDWRISRYLLSRRKSFRARTLISLHRRSQQYNRQKHVRKDKIPPLVMWIFCYLIAYTEKCRYLVIRKEVGLDWCWKPNLSQ